MPSFKIHELKMPECGYYRELVETLYYNVQILIELKNKDKEMKKTIVHTFDVLEKHVPVIELIRKYEAFKDD